MLIGSLSCCLLLGLIALSAFLFWIWMIVDCAMNEPSEGNDKIVWILILVFTQLLGSLLYFFIRRPNAAASTGGEARKKNWRGRDRHRDRNRKRLEG